MGEVFSFHLPSYFLKASTYSVRSATLNMILQYTYVQVTYCMKNVCTYVKVPITIFFDFDQEEASF